MESDADVAVTPEEMRDGLLKQLYDNRSGLKGIALVQALKALAALVPPASPDDEDDSKPFSVIDQLDALPKAEGQRLLRQEITRLREEVAALEAALIATAD
jgi:hypothetical protein